MKKNITRKILAALMVCMMFVSAASVLPITGVKAEEAVEAEAVTVETAEATETEETAAEEAAVEETAAEETVAEETAAEETVVEETVVEETVVEEIVVEETEPLKEQGLPSLAVRPLQFWLAEVLHQPPIRPPTLKYLVSPFSSSAIMVAAQEQPLMV